MCLNTWKGISCLRRSTWTFLLFPKWLIFHLNFGAKFLKLDIVFLRYGNFTEDVTTDWWKVDFEKKALKNWESVKVLVFWQFRGLFDMKTLFLQVTLRLSIEDSKVCEISQLTLGIYFEIFWFCIPITQNLIFRKLVPFDMLSHLLVLMN